MHLPYAKGHLVLQETLNITVTAMGRNENCALGIRAIKDIDKEEYLICKVD